MFLLYADEFGHDGAFDPADARRRHHPLFGLAGIAVHAEQWKDMDRGYLALKQSFYGREISRLQLTKGLRPERFEPKELRDRRDTRFASAVLGMLARLGVIVFAHGVEKHPGPRYHQASVYGSMTQGLMRKFEKFLRERQSFGSIIFDRRTEARDVEVTGSAQSHLFSSSFRRLIEVPLLVRSEWHHAIQAADTVARVIGKVYWYRICGEGSCKSIAEALGHGIDALASTVVADPGQTHSTIYIKRLPPPAPPLAAVVAVLISVPFASVLSAPT